MPSRAQLLSDHGSVLVLDAASSQVQVGLLRAGLPDRWRRAAVEAGTGIFVETDRLFRDEGFDLERTGAFAYCEGPGSSLGIRTVAMAIRTWQALRPRPAFAYQSLAVAGRLAWTQSHHAVAVVADARRETWHCQVTDEAGRPGPLTRKTAADLPAGELLTPADFRRWSALPRPLTPCSYDLAVIFPALGDDDYFHPVTSPDVFQHEAPEYRKWAAQVHQAPVTPRR